MKNIKQQFPFRGCFIRFIQLTKMSKMSKIRNSGIQYNFYNFCYNPYEMCTKQVKKSKQLKEYEKVNFLYLVCRIFFVRRLLQNHIVLPWGYFCYKKK